jgi:hypothetical protein
MNVSASATDSDIPTNTLTFSLVLPPAGMIINPATGEINWTPSEGQAPSTNTISLVVMDNGSPNLGATNSFVVVVTAPEAVSPTTIQSIAITNGVAFLTFTSVSNHVYRLQFKPDLSATSWTDVAPDITATNSTASCTNLCGPAEQRFFRIEVVH